jgi:hypothetical protein
MRRDKVQGKKDRRGRGSVALAVYIWGFLCCVSHVGGIWQGRFSISSGVAGHLTAKRKAGWFLYATKKKY